MIRQGDTVTNETKRPDEPGVEPGVESMREQLRSLMGELETQAEEPSVSPEPVPPAPAEPEPVTPPEQGPEPTVLPEQEPDPEPEPPVETDEPAEDFPESAEPEEAPVKKPRRSLWELPVFRLFRREQPKPQEQPQHQPPVSAYIPDGPEGEDAVSSTDDGPELLTDILPPSHMRREEPAPVPEAVQPQPEEVPEIPEPVAAEEPSTEAGASEEPEHTESQEDIPDDVPLSDSEWAKLSESSTQREMPKKPSVQEERRVQVLTLHVRKREDADPGTPADRPVFDQDEMEIEPRRPAPKEPEEDWEQMTIPGLSPEEVAEPEPPEAGPSEEPAPPEQQTAEPAPPVSDRPSQSESVNDEDEDDGEAPEGWEDGVPDESLRERPERGPSLIQRVAAGAVVVGGNLQKAWARHKAASDERRRSAAKNRPAPREDASEDAPQAQAQPPRQKKPVSRPVRQETPPAPPKDNVVEMPPPEQPGLFQRKLEEMEERANQFADSMFQSESEEEQEQEAMHRMAEQHIPGTDEERPPRKPKKQKKPERDKRPARRIPDTSPRELARIYSGSWRSIRGRLPFQLIIAVLLLAVTAVAGDELPFLTGTILSEDAHISGLLLAGGLLLACALGLDTLLEGILQLFRGRPGLNTLSSIGVIFTLIDALWYATLGRDGPLPFCGFAALSLWTVAWGNSRKKEGQKRSSEDVAARTAFERLTMDEGKWEDRGTFMKEPGSARGFGRQIQDLDGAEQVYRYAAPVMMIACLVFGILSAVGQGAPQRLIWSWSVIFILATPLSATLAYGLPYARLVKRLHSAGAVIAGWDGAASMQGEAGVVFTDRDLFPEGSVERKDIRSFGYVSLEKLIGCTASIIREADVGLAGVFDDLVRIHGGFYRRVDDLSYSNARGFSGTIRGDQVLVGTADFMQVMKIEISPGYQVRNAVFCAINGQLQGVFPLIYSLPSQVRPAVNYLIAAGVHPILATRDFNITPAVLRQRFHLPVNRMQYPSVEHRFALSAKGQPHNDTLGALIFREGVDAYTAAILGGRRLVTVVRLNTILTVAASVIGGLLGFYLTMMSAYASLSPVNILIFLLAWLVPTLLISIGADQF